MNPTNYETHTFHLNDNMLESRSLFYNVDQELNGPGSRRREWDAETEKTLLQLIIERKFHLEHNTVPNARKNAMWNTLHQDFCNHPNVIHYSKTLLGQIFAQKIRNVRYIKDKFKKMKSDFRKVVVEVRKAGPDSPPPQSRYEHFDEMKEITLGDSNFWPLKVVETDRVRNGAPCSVVYTLRPDGCTYDISYIDETSLTPRFPEAAQSSSFQFVQARVPVVPRPTPEPPSTQMTISSVPRGNEESGLEYMYRILEVEEENRKIYKAQMMEMASDAREINKSIAQTLQAIRSRDLADIEARHLDRISREKFEERELEMKERIAEKELKMKERIAEKELEMKKIISDEDIAMREREMKSRERVAELEFLARQTSTQHSPFTNTTNK